MNLNKFIPLFLLPVLLISGCTQNQNASNNNASLSLQDCGVMTQSDKQPGQCFYRKIPGCEPAKLQIHGAADEIVKLSIAQKGDKCAVGLEWVSIDRGKFKELAGLFYDERYFDKFGKSITCDLPKSHQLFTNYAGEPSDSILEFMPSDIAGYLTTSAQIGQDNCYGQLADEAKEMGNRINSTNDALNQALIEQCKAFNTSNCGGNLDDYIEQCTKDSGYRCP